jgi:hypothetical protein
MTNPERIGWIGTGRMGHAHAHGHGDTDFAALILEVARGAGIELGPESVATNDGLGSTRAGLHAYSQRGTTNE